MRKKISLLLILMLFATILALTAPSITRFAYAAGPSTNLPPGTVSATYNYPGSNSYWTITLSSVPSGYDVTNAIYVGWCCDETFTINNGATLGVKLYSSYDPLDPYTHNVAPGDWNKVNYIINHKQGTADDVQAAIWHYIDSNGGNQADPDVIVMETAADANGGSFVPTHGQLLAVVLYLAGSQTTFIEVTVPTVQLTVTSAYDSPTPTSGSYTPGDGITASVTPIVAGLTGTQYVCIGWTGTGSVPASGTATTVTFTIAKDSSITWLWKTQYYLTVQTSPPGIGTIPGAGWYDENQGVPLTAPINLGVYRLITMPFSWDVDGASQGVANPINVVMNAQDTATAYYTDPSIGGEWAPITLQALSPINAFHLLAPWIALTLVAAASAVAMYRRLLKKRW